METRELVLQHLKEGKTPSEIARMLSISKPAVSKHLAKLVVAGLWKKPQAQKQDAQASPPSGQKRNSRIGGPPGNKKAIGNRGNPHPRPPIGNHNALKTGEHSRAEEFAADMEAAPIDPTAMLQLQAKRNGGRLQFMYRLLWQTEQRLEELAASGDGSALTALAVLEVNRKQEPRSPGEGKPVELVDVELSTKSRSLLDTWIAQHDAITRVEALYGRTAERLKPKDNEPPPDAGADKLDQLVERMEAAARAASVQPQTS